MSSTPFSTMKEEPQKPLLPHKIPNYPSIPTYEIESCLGELQILIQESNYISERLKCPTYVSTSLNGLDQLEVEGVGAMCMVVGGGWNFRMHPSRCNQRLGSAMEAIPNMESETSTKSCHMLMQISIARRQSDSTSLHGSCKKTVPLE